MIKNNRHILVFDLDDTLYKEIDFLKSAFHEIAVFLSAYLNYSVSFIYDELLQFYHNGNNAFEVFIASYGLHDRVRKESLVAMYRSHQPDIKLSAKTKEILYRLKQQVYKVGLITDGRSLQQRHKIKALGLENYFHDMVISEEFGSEKPALENFKYFEDKYGSSCQYFYVGDNTNKDFIGPNTLGWTTICIQDNGKNIHPQSVEASTNHAPKYFIDDLSLIESLLLNVTSCQ